jgi:glycosyltransferase involved in cell wall biosynthesis
MPSLKNQPASLLIFGDVRAGDDKRLFEEIESSIPNGKIHVTGYVSNHDLPSYYSVMAVIVNPCLRDGMPNAIVEAIACGKAVIATQAGGVMDMLRDGKNGRMVFVNDVNSLSTVIQKLMSDKPLQGRLGAAARRNIPGKFNQLNGLNGNLGA